MLGLAEWVTVVCGAVWAAAPGGVGVGTGVVLFGALAGVWRLFWAGVGVGVPGSRACREEPGWLGRWVGSR